MDSTSAPLVKGRLQGQPRQAENEVQVMAEAVSTSTKRECSAPRSSAFSRHLVGPIADSGSHASAKGYLDSQVGQATILARQGRRQEAIELFRRVIVRQPDHTQAHYNLGV